MKIIKSGMTYRVHGDDLIVLDSLPSKTYAVRFNPDEGYSLVERPDLTEKGKVYGKREDKVNKVWDSFMSMNRSLGVLMTGDKGIGKSLFSRMISEKASKEGIPTIIVDTDYPQITKFLDSIEQEVVVLFDEFEKVFPAHRGAQDPLLSLFDGVSQQKRLYIVTANDIHGLSPFMISRPGRFHYHIRFEYPTISEISEYLQDSLNHPTPEVIESVTKFSFLHPLNYDCLRAIVFELNRGETLKTALLDLNIMKVNGGGIFDLEFILEGNRIIKRTMRLSLDGDYFDFRVKIDDQYYAFDTYIEEDLLSFGEDGIFFDLSEEMESFNSFDGEHSIRVLGIKGTATAAKSEHYVL